ncbi:MAG: nicotinate-nucleotide--dimethylbenzimidazole phosphoribosyltransferase [Treponemataceae bacterium]|nr:nicotinate-nucleotide--dimethylbenzimidazole phosphoribosyltransferase [Treponemataceae bacterium]
MNYKGIYNRIKKEWDSLAKPLDSLGKFEDIVSVIGAAQNTIHPSVEKSVLLVLCADNGIVEEEVSQSPASVTRICAENIAAGKSSAGIMASKTGTDLIVVDMGIDCDTQLSGVLDRKIRQGSRNFLKEAALSHEELEKAISIGIELAEDCKKKGYDIICIGEMGIGNTTTSAAVVASLLGLPAESAVGRGAGLSDEGLYRKRYVVARGIKSYDLYDAPVLDIVRTVGGYDIAGMIGVFEGARRCGLPVILDGAISLVAALAAERIFPGVKRFYVPSHKSREPLTSLVCKTLEIEPVLDADMALGEGTGALLMLGMVKTVVAVYNQALRFRESGVEQYQRF